MQKWIAALMAASLAGSSLPAGAEVGSGQQAQEEAAPPENAPLVTPDMLRTWGIPSDKYQALPEEQRAGLDAVLVSVLEPTRKMKVELIEDRAGNAVARYVDQDGLPTVEGNQFIEQAASGVQLYLVEVEEESAGESVSLSEEFGVPTELSQPWVIGEAASAAGGFIGALKLLEALSYKTAALDAAKRAIGFRDLAQALAAKASAAFLAGKFKEGALLAAQARQAGNSALAEKATALKNKDWAEGTASAAKIIKRVVGVFEIADGVMDISEGFSGSFIHRAARDMGRDYRRAFEKRQREELPDPRSGYKIAANYAYLRKLEVSEEQKEGLAQVIQRTLEAVDAETAGQAIPQVQAEVKRHKKLLHKSKKRIWVGFIKTAGGTVSFVSTFLAPEAAPLVGFIGAITYGSAACYQQCPRIIKQVKETFANSAEFYRTQRALEALESGKDKAFKD